MWWGSGRLSSARRLISEFDWLNTHGLGHDPVGSRLEMVISRSERHQYSRVMCERVC